MYGMSQRSISRRSFVGMATAGAAAPLASRLRPLEATAQGRTVVSS